MSASDADISDAAQAGEPDPLAQAIAGDISSGAILNEGRLPPERALAERFGVSRARLRRALDALEVTGRIYRRHGQGTFAMPPPAADGGGRLATLARQITPRDVMEVRLEIEPALAALAAERAEAPERTQLRQMMEATLNVDRREAYEVADDIFHYRIATAARNPLFLQVYESIRTVRKKAAWTRSREESHSRGTMGRFGTQHRAIYDAIAARDPAAAREAMEFHLLEVSHALSRHHRR